MSRSWRDSATVVPFDSEPHCTYQIRAKTARNPVNEIRGVVPKQAGVGPLRHFDKEGLLAHANRRRPTQPALRNDVVPRSDQLRYVEICAGAGLLHNRSDEVVDHFRVAPLWFVSVVVGSGHVTVLPPTTHRRPAA